MAREEKIKSELGQRLRAIRSHFGDPDRDVFCLRLRISKGSLGNYERGDRVPDSSVLQSYRMELGVDANWLLTGTGEMFADPAKAPAPNVALDPELMERLYKEVERAYRDEGQKAPQHRLAHEAATLYNLLLVKLTDIREPELVDAVIPVLIKDLKKRLQTAVEEPGTGKHSA